MATTYTVQQVLNASTQGQALGAAIIVDSATDVLSSLDSLESLASGGKIASISFTDATAPAISLPATQAAGDQQAVALFQGSFSLSLTGASVAQAQQLAALPHVSIGVSDVPSAVAAGLDSLQTLATAGHLSAIEIPVNSPLQSETTLTLTQAQLANDATAIGLIVPDQAMGLGQKGVTFTISGSFALGQAVAAEELNGYLSGLTAVSSLATLEATLNSAPTRPQVREAYNTLTVPGYFNFAALTLTDSGPLTIVLPFNNSTLPTTGLLLQNAEGFLGAITNQHSVEWTGVHVSDVAGLLDSNSLTPSKAGTLSGVSVAIQDNSADVGAAIDALEAYSAKGEIQSIIITDGVLPTFTSAQSTLDAGVIAKITLAGTAAAAAATAAASLAGVAVKDSAANVANALDGLESLAAAGKLAAITLTDSGTPALTITATQLTSDAAALATVKGSFQLDVTPVAGTTLKGMSGVATTVDLLGNAADYSFKPAGNGSDLTVSGYGGVYQVSGVQALQFADHQVIVAAAPGSASAVTGGNMAELYSAVFGREPDVPGLAFYQAYLKANPGTALPQYAQWFLSSSEYVNNLGHAYAQSATGDAQFISDIYNNLLHRPPVASEVNFYQNVITPYIQGLTPGGTAYANAELQAHALVLTYLSQSPEFLSGVQITPTNTVSAQHWLLLV